MPARRAALLATAAVCAIAAPSAAWASWTTTSPGTAAALAGSLTAPAPAFGTTTCTGKGTGNMSASVAVSWPAVPGAASYDVQSDTAPLGSQSPASVTGTSTAITVDPKKSPTLNVRLRSRAGNWLTAYGTTISETVSCP
jgi:hypothetical protein